MNRLDAASYPDIARYMEKDACGVVYPLSIVERNQYGDIYTEGSSVLLWHDCGFAFLYGVCGNSFLEQIYTRFLCPESILPRRFVLFTASDRVERFFRGKERLAFGTRYSYEYPHQKPVHVANLPLGYSVRDFDESLFGSVQGRITPRFSWRDASAFLGKGKGCCVLHEGRAVAWAFSAAVSSDEIDIGIETASDDRKRGLGTCVAEMMVERCFMQGKRPVWSCDAANLASQKLAEKAGFQKVSAYTVIKGQ